MSVRDYIYLSTDDDVKKIENKYLLFDNYIDDRTQLEYSKAVLPIQVTKKKKSAWVEEEGEILKELSKNLQFKQDGMKYRMARCLLDSDGEKHNGFVAILSKTQADMNHHIRLAGEYKCFKPLLAGDHFDQLVCFPIGLLKDAVLGNLDERKAAETAMKNYVVVHFSMIESLHMLNRTQVEISFQLITLIRRFCKEMETIQLKSRGWHYILIGMNFRNSLMEFKLPGGKRHLAENSYEAAVRELYEETSLFLPYKSYRKTRSSKRYIEYAEMRFFLATVVSEEPMRCSSFVQLLPGCVSKERCRICLDKKKKGLKKTGPCQSRRGCLKCKEIVCKACFPEYDHDPSKRKTVKRRKKVQY